MAFKLAHIVVGLICTAGFLLYVNSQGSNCASGANCADCADGYFGLVTLTNGRVIRVCCPGCRSKYFRYQSDPKPGCTCDFDRMVNNETCSKGEQCCGCEYDKPLEINSMPVCCAQCKAGRITASSTKCGCVIR